MQHVTVNLELAPAEEVRVTVLEGLRAYNRQHAPPPGFEPLVVAVRDGERVIGGLVGETGWQWLHVQLLWVAEAYRGRGLGRQLLDNAEREAGRRGARAAYLDTFDFQARPFYERAGYVTFGVQEGFPPGHSRFYLRKDLVATP